METSVKEGMQTSFPLDMNLKGMGVLALGIVFFLQAARLIVAVLVANYYEYVPLYVLILLGFALLLAPLTARFVDLQYRPAILLVSGVAISRIALVFVSNGAIQLFLAIIMGLCSLLVVSLFHETSLLSKYEMVMALTFVPALDLLLKLASFGFDLTYHFDIVQFVYLLVFLGILVYFAKSLDSLPKKGNYSFTTGLNLFLALLLYLSYFTNPGIIVNLFSVPYTFGVTILVVSSLLLPTIVPFLYYSRNMVLRYAISILFALTVMPLIYYTGKSNFLLVLSYFLTYFLLWSVSIMNYFNSNNNSQSTSVVNGSFLGLFLFLLFIMLQLLYNYPIILNIYCLILAGLSLKNGLVMEVQA